jgi:DNA-binding transcriptional regulator YdaS (Cro superfamily)
MQFKRFWLLMTPKERKEFARRCDATVGHLNNVAYEARKCSAELAINIDRESGAHVTCEEVCPNVDWGYLRESIKRVPLSPIEIAHRIQSAAAPASQESTPQHTD